MYASFAQTRGKWNKLGSSLGQFSFSSPLGNIINLDFLLLSFGFSRQTYRVSSVLTYYIWAKSDAEDYLCIIGCSYFAYWANCRLDQVFWHDPFDYGFWKKQSHSQAWRVRRGCSIPISGKFEDFLLHGLNFAGNFPNFFHFLLFWKFWIFFQK